MSHLPFELPTRPASSPPLVEYVLVAEFDIDKGSTVRHCYPSSSIFDETYTSDYFANNMLPEGAHNRTHDWTYMLLHRSRPQLDEVVLSSSPTPISLSLLASLVTAESFILLTR